MAAQLLQIAGCSWSRARGSGTRLAAVTTTAVLSVQYLIETCMPRAPLYEQEVGLVFIM